MQLIHSDCLEKMKDIPDKSIDMILCDLPYGTTACKWDVVIPFNKYVQIGKKVIYEQEYVFDKMKSGASYKEALEDFLSISKDGLWDNYKRIIKDRGAIVLFGSEPFSSYLRMSNIKQYKYDWVWNKVMPTGFAGCKKTPMYVIENVLVFGAKVNYYPQMTRRKKVIDSSNWKQDKRRSENARFTSTDDTLARKVYTEKYPVNYLEYNRANAECNNTVRAHPTQKPVALLEYLIKTYTLEGETVLDNCMGSFSTAIACLNTKRSFIGIEKDAHYFQVGKDRVEKHLITLDYNPEIVYYQV